ncbi:MAG TPA: tetratricopeptide repeat protein [Vicinamibacterales bacterium]|nr:tetratricopeptide repeat protein [Vicinamibacterales bacterium]
MAAVCVAAACTAIAWTPVHAQSTVAELNDAGWKALRDGNGRKAETLFAEALALRPDDAVLMFGAGAAAHVEGHQRDAMARLQRALEVNPRLTPASQLLGRIAYGEGDVDLAIRTYEQALKMTPNNAAMARELEAWRKETSVHSTFEARKYDRFRVMFEGRAEESLALQATTILDSAFRRIGDTLGEYPSETIVAVLYTEKQFRDITRAPQWSGALYDGRIRVPAAGASQEPALFARVLTHELTHAVIANIVPPRTCPTWLNEGLAQHFEGADPEAARRRMKTLGGRIPLKDLSNGFMSMNAAMARVAYDESLLAVEVMFDRPGFGWTRLLHRLADGQTFEQAIVNFGFSYADLEAPFTK